MLGWFYTEQYIKKRINQMSDPQHTPLKSSNILSVAHDGVNLHIKFAGGGHYIYPNCPAEHHQGMIDAPSAGKYFASKIRDKFKGQKQ